MKPGDEECVINDIDSVSYHTREQQRVNHPVKNIPEISKELCHKTFIYPCENTEKCAKNWAVA